MASSSRWEGVITIRISLLQRVKDFVVPYGTGLSLSIQENLVFTEADTYRYMHERPLLDTGQSSDFHNDTWDYSPVVYFLVFQISSFRESSQPMFFL